MVELTHMSKQRPRHIRIAILVFTLHCRKQTRWEGHSFEWVGLRKANLQHRQQERSGGGRRVCCSDCGGLGDKDGTQDTVRATLQWNEGGIWIAVGVTVVAGQRQQRQLLCPPAPPPLSIQRHRRSKENDV